MPKIAFTAPFIKSAVCPTGRRHINYSDTECKWLVLEVRATGGATYYLRRRDQRGVIRQIRLADAADVTLTQARALADKAKNAIAMGKDPNEEKSVLRSVPTFGDFIEKQHLPHIKSYKRSWDTDLSILKNHLLPRFAKKYMDEITRSDITKLVSDRLAEGAKPGTVNRSLIMMRYIFNCALKWEVAGLKSNPTKGVPILEENNKKERYLDVDEAQRLYGAVTDSRNPMLKHIVAMLILTGARKREVLDAKWEDFDIERKSWRISMSKSGKARYVPLNDGALNILSSLINTKNGDFVFCNPDTGKPYVSFYSSWNTAREQAGLKDVRVHDLRHSFASLLVNQGRTLYEVQKILGHTQVKTTQRYAHLSHDTLLDATNSVNTALSGMFLPMITSTQSSSLLSI